MADETDNCIFIKPDETMLEQISSYRSAFLSAGEKIYGAGLLPEFEDPMDWLHHNRISEHRETVPAGRVPSEQFVLFRSTDHKIVGMITFRHEFNDFTREYGGNIGYSVHPDERGKGYAKRMLTECLGRCRAFGLKHVLITCLVENEASRRTILSCGGVYEKTVFCERDNVYLERYWISLDR
jgi:predicted acetyltransferase